MDSRGAVLELQTLCQAGAAEGVLGQQLAKVHADGVLQRDVVILSHQYVMEEAKCGPLHPQSSLWSPLGWCLLRPFCRKETCMDLLLPATLCAQDISEQKKLQSPSSRTQQRHGGANLLPIVQAMRWLISPTTLCASEQAPSPGEEDFAPLAIWRSCAGAETARHTRRS